MKERTFEERWEQNILTGSAFWRVQTAPDWRVSVSGAWQAVIDGDPLSSSQYFYLATRAAFAVMTTTCSRRGGRLREL